MCSVIYQLENRKKHNPKEIKNKGIKFSDDQKSFRKKRLREDLELLKEPKKSNELLLVIE